MEGTIGTKFLDVKGFPENYEVASYRYTEVSGPTSTSQAHFASPRNTRKPPSLVSSGVK